MIIMKEGAKYQGVYVGGEGYWIANQHLPAQS